MPRAWAGVLQRGPSKDAGHTHFIWVPTLLQMPASDATIDINIKHTIKNIYCLLCLSVNIPNICVINPKKYKITKILNRPGSLKICPNVNPPKHCDRRPGEFEGEFEGENRWIDVSLWGENLHKWIQLFRKNYCTLYDIWGFFYTNKKVHPQDRQPFVCSICCFYELKFWEQARQEIPYSAQDESGTVVGALVYCICMFACVCRKCSIAGT